MAGPFFAASLTFVLMLAAMYWHRRRRFHITVMVSVMLRSEEHTSELQSRGLISYAVFCLKKKKKQKKY